MHFVKRPGAVLEAGCELARLELDDPSRVNKAQPFEGTFPQAEGEDYQGGDKLNQQFVAARQMLENVLEGYALPDPYFQVGPRALSSRWDRSSSVFGGEGT